MQKTAYRYHFFQGRIFVFFVSKRTIFHSVQIEPASMGTPNFMCVRWRQGLFQFHFLCRPCYHSHENFGRMWKIVPMQAFALSLCSNVQVGFGVIVYVFDRCSFSSLSFLDKKKKKKKHLETHTGVRTRAHARKHTHKNLIYKRVVFVCLSGCC